jgi:hypothetical protein
MGHISQALSQMATTILLQRLPILLVDKVVMMYRLAQAHTRARIGCDDSLSMGLKQFVIDCNNM